jgi:hypothetical protein
MLRKRILIPRGHWTPFPERVFTDELRRLKQNGGAALYLHLIDAASHRPSPLISTTRAQLAATVNMDERVIKNCLDELRSHKFIQLRNEGVAHSHVNMNCWLVPAAHKNSLADGWTPIPRLLVSEYLPVYRNAALLSVLLYFQHMGWNNDCWMGVEKLGEVLNWSPGRIRDALRTMATESGWSSLKTGLPRSLSVRTVKQSKPANASYTSTVRHYRVLAMEYTTQQQRFRRSVYIPKEFRDRFGIRLSDDIQEDLSSIFRFRKQFSSTSEEGKTMAAEA